MQSQDTFEGPGSALEALARGIAALVSSPAPKTPGGPQDLKSTGRNSWLAPVFNSARGRADQKPSAKTPTSREGSL